MLNLVYFNKLLNKNKSFYTKKIVKTSKHFPSSTREWRNSIYLFNKNNLNLIPTSENSSMNIIKSYFSLFNEKIENKTRIQRLRLKFRRLSSNKIYVSNGEFKHTNDKVIINLYIFNREKNNLKQIIDEQEKKLVRNLKITNNLLNERLKFVRKEGILDIIENVKKYYSSKKYNVEMYNYINVYMENFLKKYEEVIKYKMLLYWYYRQLRYTNNLKFNYKFLQYLKKQLYKLYNKEVEFNLVNTKRIYLNSDILSESITRKITRNRKKIVRYLKNLKDKIKIKKVPFLYKYITIKNKKKNLSKNTRLLEKAVIKKLKYKKITGFRIEAKGRLTKRYTASRSALKVGYKGNLLNIDSSLRGLSTVLLKGNLNSNIQYTKLTSKSRIGSFGIKGWVGGN